MLNKSFFLIAVLLLTSKVVLASDLPTVEQFQSALSTCAAGMKVEVDGELRGSIIEIYRGSGVEAGKFRWYTVGEFLSLLPEKDRLAGFKIYNECITKILLNEKENKKKITEIYTIPSQLTTYGKDLYIKAKTVIANDSEIRAFPPAHMGPHGAPGRSGNNGGNGTNGSGGSGGHGQGGTNGGSGGKGDNAGKIHIEASQFIGSLRVNNAGALGGRGGPGGDGGNGGAGGRGSSAVSGAFDCRRGPGNGGGGGNAGSGGDGGRGGDGGHAGAVFIKVDRVEPGASLAVFAYGGTGGFGGSGGRRGSPGNGGAVGSYGGRCGRGGRQPGAPGVHGNNGRSGGNGQRGVDGQIEVLIDGELSSQTSKYIKRF